MEDHAERRATLRARRNLGLGLMLAGLIPMATLMISIVMVGSPPMIMIVGTVLSFIVFFTGKTIMKASTISSAKLDEADAIR